MNNYTDEQRINAVKKLAQFRGQPVVIRYREAGSRALVYVGGGLELRKGKPPVWDGKGVEVSQLIAIATNEADYNSDGVKVERYYAHGTLSGKGIGLINAVNHVSKLVYGQPIYDINNTHHVNARGTML